jgi:hypothetical protein
VAWEELPIQDEPEELVQDLSRWFDAEEDKPVDVDVDVDIHTVEGNRNEEEEDTHHMVEDKHLLGKRYSSSCP